MSSDLAIRVDGLSKAYTVRHRRHDHVTLAQTALERVKHPLQRDQREEFWALRDVSFEVKQGEVLGIIGRNGAGKSTLLKLLTRITAPTKGRIDLWGRVGSLLEVGTGFHPELTGRENVYLNGSILGMHKREIDRQFDAIVDFAGVEKFLDTPVKRYSSGMYVRLAFAVAAHLETEILLLDEVLAVGDAEFQRKCLAQIQQISSGGRTVLLVSHDTSSISNYCDRALLLDQGRLAHLADAAETVNVYRSARAEITPVVRSGSSGLVRVHLSSDGQRVVTPSEPKHFSFVVESLSDATPAYFVSATIVNDDNRVVAHCDSRLGGEWFEPNESHEITLTLTTPWLQPGRHRVDFFVCSNGILETVEGAYSFLVTEESPYASPLISEAVAGAPILTEFTYRESQVVGLTKGR